MPSAIDQLAKIAGDAVGVAGGGPAQVKAAASLAYVRQSLLDKVTQLGSKFGGRAGSDFAEAFAAGAKPAAAQARADESGRLLGLSVDPRNVAVYSALAAGGLILYLLLRKR